MDVNFWHYLRPEREQQTLRQRLPEVAIFSNHKLSAHFVSDASGVVQHRAATPTSRRELLDRFLALAALAVGKHSFDGESPAAILRRSIPKSARTLGSDGRPTVTSVLSVCQLRSLLSQQDSEQGSIAASSDWSLQPLVRPAHDTLVHVAYSCDSFGGEFIEVLGRSYQDEYGLTHEEGIARTTESAAAGSSDCTEVPEHLALEARRCMMALVRHLHACHQPSVRQLSVEFLEDRSGHLVLHALLTAEKFEAGYPLYPPKSMSDDRAASPHIVQRLWPSDVPSPLRAGHPHRGLQTGAVAPAPSPDGPLDSRLMVADADGDADSDYGANDISKPCSVGTSSASLETLDRVGSPPERGPHASGRASNCDVSARQRVPRLPSQCLSARLPVIRGRAVPAMNTEAAVEGQMTSARERVRSLDLGPLQVDQTPRLAARDRVRSLDSRPDHINHKQNLAASMVQHALSARSRCDLEPSAMKEHACKPPIGELVRSLDLRPFHVEQVRKSAARDRVRSLASRPVPINNTPSLPASTVQHALSARSRCDSEQRPKKKLACKPPVGDLVAAPAPRTLQRPFAAAAASIVNPETHEPYELPQDGKARCPICTLPLPCQHSDEQCRAFARKR